MTFGENNNNAQYFVAIGNGFENQQATACFTTKKLNLSTCRLKYAHKLIFVTDELDNDEAVILNLCLKCQPSQPSNAMKVNTLSGKEAVSCDICGLTLSSTLKDDEQESSIDSKSENIAEPAEVVRTEAKSPSETVGTVGKPSESLGTPKKHPNGIVTSESVSSLSEPSLQEKDKQDNRTILKLLEKGEKIR